MIHVPDRPDIQMRLVTIKFLFSHRCLLKKYFISIRNKTKALDQGRTDDLILTKDALCQLSYEGVHERETGFEPAA